MHAVLVGRHPVDGAEPHLLGRRQALGLDVIGHADGAELERATVLEKAAHFLRQIRQQFLVVALEVAQLLGRWHVGHAGGVVHAGLVDLERARHVENLLAVLDRNDAPVGEALAVATAIDLVDDRRAEVAAPQEIRVQRVARPPLDGAVGRD